MDKPSERQIYLYVNYQGDGTDCADLCAFLRDERAGRLKAEFDANCFLTRDECRHKEHSWTFTNWQSLAHRQLMGEE